MLSHALRVCPRRCKRGHVNGELCGSAIIRSVMLIEIACSDPAAFPTAPITEACCRQLAKRSCWERFEDCAGLAGWKLAGGGGGCGFKSRQRHHLNEERTHG